MNSIYLFVHMQGKEVKSQVYVCTCVIATALVRARACERVCAYDSRSPSGGTVYAESSDSEKSSSVIHSSQMNCVM